MHPLREELLGRLPLVRLQLVLGLGLLQLEELLLWVLGPGLLLLVVLLPLVALLKNLNNKFVYEKFKGSLGAM